MPGMRDPLLSKKDSLPLLYLDSFCHAKDTPENNPENNSGDVANQILIHIEEANNKSISKTSSWFEIF